MGEHYNLERFVDAQRGAIETALGELRNGLKESHWMWFIFPQLAGLGRSATSKFYGIGSADEAAHYLDHPVLGTRLRACVEIILAWSGRRSAEEMMGALDAMKLHSSLTLFDEVCPQDVFRAALAAFFEGKADEATLALLNQHA